MKKVSIYGYCNRGYCGQVISIETDIRNGFPGFDIIGLGDKAISEAKDRVRTALRNCGFKFPQQRVLVSLSPASVPKQGSLLDLGIALGILFAASGAKIQREGELKVMCAGELSLDGKIVRDSSTVGAVSAARRSGCHICLVPFPTRDERGVFEVDNLYEAFVLCGKMANSTDPAIICHERNDAKNSIFGDVLGLEHEKDVLCIAAAGAHSLLLFGPPGVGKTMLSSKFSRLLPNLSFDDSKTVSHIAGCAGMQDAGDFIKPKGYIVPHDCTALQFVKGELPKSPGLGALCHRGVLVLDEMNKYSQALLEAVKDAYDKGLTVCAKGGETVEYPARFIMVGNLNPCSCGGLGSREKLCTCTSQKIDAHWRRIGRPLIERFDIRMPVSEYDITHFLGEKSKPDSSYTEKILVARERQKRRFAGVEDVKYNGELHFSSCAFGVFKDELDLFRKMFSDSTELNNARTLIGLVSLARSIADYDDRDGVTEEDFAKALEFRRYCMGDYFWREVRP